MGVPVFFKWMCMRNPKMLKDAAEPPPDQLNSPNPAVDNFYVDMNGLIHPSVNPKDENIRVPENFQEQCENIFLYIDKIINIVRPRKLLYLAIDGVAPRAKMNQQRSRRFRAAMQGLQSQQKKEELLSQFRQRYGEVTEIQQYVNKKSFDSNLITPGTTFLTNIGLRIREYIRRKIESDRLWRNLTVIFSDASCPGEGEHKIMEYIRQQRASENYNPNQVHCIYGADADLIMLGLATHEPRFYIIREVVVTAMDKWCTSCGRKGHYFTDCRGAGSIENEQEVQNQANQDSINVNFQYLNLKLVRQYLHTHYKNATMGFKYDLERILDDFVFLCFFVGNDFLPHIPCLTIREGGIDLLMRVYEYCLSIMEDYLTLEGQVNPRSLKVFINEMKHYEKDIIKEIVIKESQSKNKEERIKGEKEREKKRVEEELGYKFQQKPGAFQDPLATFKEELRRQISPENSLQNYSVFGHDIYNYKEKYYREKFRIEPKEFMRLRRCISVAYVEALNWIHAYYYKGVPSWSWFYPFHYSPFFSDIEVDEQPQFQLGRPFQPFQQLMAVLPPKTCHALPECLQKLMLEPDSPLADYFPVSFKIDLVGKKFAWLGEVLLPFIDERRLIRAMRGYERGLNEDETARNRRGVESVFVGRFGALGKKLRESRQEVVRAECLFYEVEGVLKKVGGLGDVEEWEFRPPSGRRHDIHLKEGIEFSLLEELDDDFARRLDRKSYGGQRFVRVIERSLGKRVSQLSREKDHGHHKNHNNRSYDRRGDRSRSRDRHPRERHTSPQDREERGERRHYGQSRQGERGHRSSHQRDEGRRQQ